MVHGFMEWAVLVALAFGATFAMAILDACGTIAAAICRKLWPATPPHPFLGGILFLFLLIGLPILAVTGGYATGRLPATP